MLPAIAGLAVSTTAATAQVTIDARLASDQTNMVFPKDAMVGRPAAGGNFSLHAAGESFKNPPIVLTHDPAQTPDSEGDKFPTKIVEGPPPLKPRTVDVAVDIKKYKTNNKVFNGVRQQSGKAVKTVGTAPGPVSIYAANSALTFTDNGVGAANRFVVSSKGTTSSIVESGDKIAGRSGSLSVDPMLFDNIQSEDVLYGALSLRADDLGMTIQDPQGIAGVFAEAGSNFPGLSFGNLGADFFDNPWIYRISIVATPGANPADLGQPWDIDIEFQHNASLAFYDPHDPLSLTDDTLIPDAAVDSTITTRLRNALMRSPSDPTMLTLSGDLDLFSFRATSSSGAAQIAIEFAGGTMVSNVPEPNSVLLMVFGLFPVSTWCQKRRRVRKIGD